MANLIGFIDETGVIQKDPAQRFFALGFLRLAQTAALYEKLTLLKSNVVSGLPKLQRPFEFKFNEINRTNFGFYAQLVELYFAFPAAAFTAFVIDKQSPKFRMEKFYGDVWEAYIGYSRLVIHKNVGPKDRIFVMADQQTKPKASTKYYEVEVAKAKAGQRNPVYNACMMESHASLFIQLVDVLVGCVVFDFRRTHNPDAVTNQYKRDLVELLKKRLGVASLAGKLKRKEPNLFMVWPFKMGTP
jgi:Protein of unknown function (DUF3800)